MSRWVNVHLVMDDTFDRQLNMWRNVARLYTRTDYVMMLNVDFVVSPNFSEMIRQNDLAMEMLKTGDVGLVVPAFEFANGQDGLDAPEFPQDKQVRCAFIALRVVDAYARVQQVVIALVDQDKLGVFHRHWESGHRETNYSE